VASLSPAARPAACRAAGIHRPPGYRFTHPCALWSGRWRAWSAGWDGPAL